MLYDAPLGLNRWALLGVYCLISGFSCYPVGNPAAWRDIFEASGHTRAHSTLAGVAGVASAALAVAVLTPFVGSWAPVFSGVAGGVLFALGLALALGAPGAPILGSICLGLVFPLLTAAHMQVARLFSRSSNLVFDSLSIATSFSTALPAVIRLGKQLDKDSQMTVVVIALAWIVCVLDLVILPSQSFDELIDATYEHYLNTRPPRTKVFSAVLARNPALRKMARLLYAGERSRHYGQTLWQDLTAALFACVSSRFVLTLVLKLHFLLTTPRATGLASTAALALAWIPTIYFTRVAFVVSPVLLSYIVTVSAIASFALLPVSPTIAFAMLSLWSELPYSHLYMSFHQSFNPFNFEPLQSVAMALAGIALALYPVYGKLLTAPAVVSSLLIVLSVLSLVETALIHQERRDSLEPVEEGDMLIDSTDSSTHWDDAEALVAVEESADRLRQSLATTGVRSMALNQNAKESLIDFLAAQNLDSDSSHAHPPDVRRASEAIARASAASVGIRDGVADFWERANELAGASSMSDNSSSEDVKLPVSTRASAPARPERKDGWSALADWLNRGAPRRPEHQTSLDEYFVAGRQDSHTHRVIRGESSAWPSTLQNDAKRSIR